MRSRCLPLRYSPEVLAKYEPVIGLEVHVQLLTATKAFCGCANQFGSAPNTNICPVCLGLPGALPVLNAKAVEFATLASLALNCEVRERSIFARKNYFYPDLPKGYQISQFDKPHRRAWLDRRARPRTAATKRIGITRLHMEEDAGKSLHDGFADSATRTYLDLNRCGTPLAEIVSEPDIRTPDEAFEYLTRLKEILLYTGVSDCNMEEGSLRCDANVSVRARGRGEVRHQGRSEERQQLPLRPRGAGVRDRAADRGDRVRRARRAGDAPVERERGPHLLHALEGAGARLPLFSRAGSAAADCVARILGRNENEAARAARGAPRAHDRRVRTEPAGRASR